MTHEQYIMLGPHKSYRVVIASAPLIDGESWDDGARRLGYDSADIVMRNGRMLWHCFAHGMLELREQDAEEKQIDEERKERERVRARVYRIALQKLAEAERGASHERH